MASKPTKSVVLAVETSGRYGSIAVGIDDEILADMSFSGPMRHSAELFVSIKELLKSINKQSSDIGHIYITAGPGSFTGLRIAVTMAKMAVLARNIKIAAVSTLDVIAENAWACIEQESVEISRIATILDAKRKQFYYGVFAKSGSEFTKVGSDGLIRADEFIERFGGNKETIWLLGEGLVYYKEEFAGEGIGVLDKKYWPAHAKKVYSLGRKMAKNGNFVNADELIPFYLRQPDAIVKQKKK